MKGVGTVDAVLWRSAARASASPASGKRDLVFFFNFFYFFFTHLPSSSFFPLVLTAEQLAALHTAAALRPGFAAVRVVGGLSKRAMYIAVDGHKIHVRSALATLCGRPRTSKDRVLRVQ